MPEWYWNHLKGANIFFTGAGPEVLQQPRARGYREQCDRALHGLEHRLSEALFTVVLHLGTQSLTRSYQNRLILRRDFYPINHIDTEQLSPASLTQVFEKYDN